MRSLQTPKPGSAGERARAAEPVREDPRENLRQDSEGKANDQSLREEDRSAADLGHLLCKDNIEVDGDITCASYLDKWFAPLKRYKTEDENNLRA